MKKKQYQNWSLGHSTGDKMGQWSGMFTSDHQVWLEPNREVNFVKLQLIFFF